MLGKINKNYLLKVKKLSKVFEIRDAALRKRTIKAVDGVSFVINNKESRTNTFQNSLFLSIFAMF